MKILLVEDDEPLAALLKQALTGQHYLVDVAGDGKTGWELAESFEYDLILLDIILPEFDGMTFCRKLRQKGYSTRVILLTAVDASTNKVKGLDAGADDYIVKPFDWHELLARIRALLRRDRSALSPVIKFGLLQLNPNNCQVFYGGELVPLTSKEYSLLEILMRNSQRIFSASALLDNLWSFEEPPTENAVRAHVKSLRQKLKKVGVPADMIETVYGLGYRLKASQSKRELSVDSKSQENFANRLQAKMGRSPHGAADRFADRESQTQPQMSPEIATLWEQWKDKYADRMMVLEKAVIALQTGTFSEELRQEAVRQAHTLVGSVGSFGFDEASRLLRELEQTFKAGEDACDPQVDRLGELVRAVWQELGQSPAILKAAEPQPARVKQPVRLLVVDDDVPLAMALVAEASSWGMQAKVAGDLSRARAAIAREKPDVVLLDLSFPSSTEDGFTLLAELSNAQLPVPVVVFTARESFADRVKVARLGGRGFLQKPISADRVVEAIAAVLEQSAPPSAKLLVVDDDPQVLDFLRALLEPWGFQLTLLDNPEYFWATLDRVAPDLLILDVEMPEYSGIDLCQVARNDPRWENLPILFLSARCDRETVQQVFAAGADDYVAKPVFGPELIARILSRLERSQMLQKLADLDGLTGLANRRKSVQEIARMLHLADRLKQPFCFALLDLDRFKQINDRYGHMAGDRVLSYLGEFLKQNFRNEDVVARWGGEEFALGIFGSTCAQSIEKLTHLLAIFHRHEFANANRRLFRVSFSAGVAEFPKDGADWRSLYQAADAALYRAKAAGRNRIFPARQSCH